MRSIPWIKLSREEKMKAPSSTYRHWKIWTVVRSRARYSLGECPRIFLLPAVNLVPVTDHTVQTSMPASFHATSSVSAKADTRNRKSTGAMLSPCRTPTVWGSSTTSFSILRTMRFWYMCATAATKCGGAPYRSRMSRRMLWGCVVSFDKINKSYMGWQIVIFS